MRAEEVTTGESMIRRIALFKRLPTLRWRPREDEQIVPRDMQNQYPDLASDFAILEQELMPSFRMLDNEALRAQNLFRRRQLVLIVGGVMATTLGALHAARQNERWIGVTEAVVAGILTMMSFISREMNDQKKYLSNRLRAETLRGEYFLFLGRIGNYANDADRLQRLVRRVFDIKSEEN
jgi:hypothetical protein